MSYRARKCQGASASAERLSNGKVPTAIGEAYPEEHVGCSPAGWEITASHVGRWLQLPLVLIPPDISTCSWFLGFCVVREVHNGCAAPVMVPSWLTPTADPSTVLSPVPP